MEKEAAIETEPKVPGDQPGPQQEDREGRDLVAELRLAEERIRLLERDKLIVLKEAADARLPLEEQAKAAQAAFAVAQARIGELEGERDEIRALLEKFLAENWSDLKEHTPAAGVPIGLTDFLSPAESGQRAAVGGDEESEVAPPPVHRSASAPPPKPTQSPRRAPIENKEDLGQVLAAGASIETTENFARFQPVKTSHIKVSDWLQRAHDYEALRNLARDEVAEEELVSVLFLFMQKAFIRVER
ncbi:MAG: hypothetical protein VYE73_07390 [Acidobacteriota bacterium]|nr:hypothetical protein [Acidobacteriota bacterium]